MSLAVAELPPAISTRAVSARVVFFLQGERVPAARFRGHAIVAALRAAGIPCEARVPSPSVYGDTRLPWPLSRARPLYVPVSFIRRFSELRDLRADDIVIFQRPMSELPTLTLERRAAAGRRTVLDFDDTIFLNRFSRRKFRGLVGMVDHVIAGNAYLAGATGAPEKTTVIPTAVDTERFRELPGTGAKGPEAVVGWTGGSDNYPHLASAVPGIVRALERTGARFRIISDRPPPRAVAPLRAEFVRWSPEHEVEDLAAIDVGLMPLPDGAHERGKCAFKLIQHMALGRVGVASPVGVNREVVTDGVNGFFASTEQDWEDLLVRLVGDPDLRRAVGARARQRIVDAYSVRAVVPKYVSIIGDLATASQPRGGSRAAPGAGEASA